MSSSSNVVIRNGKTFVNGKEVNIPSGHNVVIRESKVFVDGKEVKNESSVIENGKEVTDPKKKAELITGSSQEIQKMTENLRKMQQQSPLFYTWTGFRQWCLSFAEAVKNYVKILKGQKIEEPKPVAPAEKKDDQPKDVKKEEKPTEKKEEKPKEADKKENPVETKKDDEEEKKNDKKEQITKAQLQPAPVSKSENTDNKDESTKQSAPDILQEPIVQGEETDDDLAFFNDEEPEEVVPEKPAEKQKVATNEQPQIVKSDEEKIVNTDGNNSIVQAIKEKGSELLEQGKQTIATETSKVVEEVKDKVNNAVSDAAQKIIGSGDSQILPTFTDQGQSFLNTVGSEFVNNNQPDTTKELVNGVNNGVKTLFS